MQRLVVGVPVSADPIRPLEAVDREALPGQHLDGGEAGGAGPYDAVPGCRHDLTVRVRRGGVQQHFAALAIGNAFGLRPG